MKRLHRAWGVCAGCAVLIFCTSGLVTNAFSIYLPFIQSENGFSGTQISSILTVRSLSSFAAMYLTGLYYRLFSYRRGMTLAGITAALGFLVFGMAKSYPVYLSAAVLIGLGYGFGSLVPVGIILNRWFNSRLSSATGICSCVTGLSTLGIPSLITVSAERLGLGFTFIAEALLVLLLSLLSGLLIKDSPQADGCEPYSVPAVRAERGKRELHLKPVIKGRAWIAFAAMLLLIGLGTNVSYCHLSMLMTSEGMSVSSAAVVILISGLILVGSKVLYGLGADRFGAFACNFVFGLPVVLGLALLPLAHGDPVLMGLCISVYSAGLGMNTVGMVVWAKELSAPADFDRNNRLFQSLYAAGGLIFSTLPGFMADRFGGSYMPAFLCCAAASLAVLLIIQCAYASAKRI